MSTRATYQINDSTFVYIHHDGYPMGAAEYMASMVETNEGLTTESFLKANERAEVTNGHHGDTEYHYVVEGDDIAAFSREWSDDSWKLIYADSLDSFIKEQREARAAIDNQ